MGFTGCASIVSGHNQSLSVTTNQGGADVSGAKCTLSNDKGTWYLTTPGSVMVHRSFNELSVNCAHDAYEPGVTMVKSSTKGMAFGNILFGGVIGAGVDMSTGAAYDYPTLVAVSMGQPAKNGDVAKKVAEPAATKVAERPTLKRGDELIYKITDKYTGVSREAAYRVDRIDGDKVVFNQGSRVESKDGKVLSMSTPIGGDMDAYAPPGGWGASNLGFGSSWSKQYNVQAGAGYGGEYDIQARVMQETTSKTPLGEIKLVEIQYEGSARRTDTTSPVVLRFDAKVWYSPEWGRVVRFESDMTPRTAGFYSMRSRESAELVALQRY
jgi:hypothetical protein